MAHASIPSRLHRNLLVAVVAFVALMQPMLTPLAPDLAGWMPNHGHIYAHGAAVPHHHPGDAAAAHEHPRSGDAAATVVFTFEDLGLFASVVTPAPAVVPATPDAIALPPAPRPARPGSAVVAPVLQPPQV